MNKRRSILINQDIRKIFTLAWPVMLGSILQTLLSTVDTYFISQLGTSESASASLGNSVSNIVFVMSALVSAGTIALVSRSYGNEKWRMYANSAGSPLHYQQLLEEYLKPFASFTQMRSLILRLMPDRRNLPWQENTFQLFF